MRVKGIKEDFIMIMIISFLGFIVEEIWMLFRYSTLDNRNMFFPFLLGYGLFVVLLYHIVGIPKKIFNKYKFDKTKSFIVYMIICFFLVSIGEILLGFFVEKTGHFYYWNYSSIPLHFTKYTSVPTSLGFALIITLFMNYAYVPLLKKIKKNDKKIPIFVIVFIMCLLVLDFNFSFKKMYNNRGRNTVWSIHLRKR